jgi:hypothetical protein
MFNRRKKSISEKVYKEEENINMSEKVESTPKSENKFVNKSSFHEAAA